MMPQMGLVTPDGGMFITPLREKKKEKHASEHVRSATLLGRERIKR